MGNGQIREPAGIRLGSIAGTTIHIEISFLILIAFFVLIDLESGNELPRALLWLPVAFLSVLIHELGHALTLAVLGFGPSQISLAGLGGLTFNPRHAKPWQDLLISLAGPLTSFALFFGAALAASRLEFARLDPMLAAFLPFLASVNLFWGIFNLLPVFPLDGGQAFRNLLRIFLHDRTAIYIASGVSVVVGAILVAYGILSRQLFLAVIAAMLTFQNVQQWRVVRSMRRNGRGEDDLG